MEQSVTVCVVVLMTVAAIIADLSTTATYPQCIFSSQKLDMFELFETNGSSLKSLRRLIVIPRQNSSSCFLNTTSMINTFNFSSNPVLGYVDISCEEPIRTHATPYEGEYMDHVVGYIKLHNCIMSNTDWNNIAAFADISVFISLGNYFSYNLQNSTKNTCTALNQLTSLIYDSGDGVAPDFSEILNCASAFPMVSEIIFQNMAWAVFPEYFRDIFPNLQSLDLPNNNLSLPPSVFPWTNQVSYLPRHLSRTPYLQNHYIVSESLDLPDNVFRRTYRLDNNQIHNLSGYAFHGLLHMISLKDNGMTDLGSDTFINVTGLQNINLCSNKLIRLPHAVFKGLTVLRKLDLCKNELRELSNDIFADLKSLTHLNLANNSISCLNSGLFSKLKQLTVIHLEHNNLTFVRAESFPIDSVVLKEIYLHHNPIIVLPEFIFWIRGLTIADFHSSQISFNNFTEYLEAMDAYHLQKSVTKSNSYIDFAQEALIRSGDYRKVDLSESNIHGISLDWDFPNSVKHNLLILLLHFQFVLASNPVNCNCKILPISNFIHGNIHNGTLSKTDYFYTDWECQYPKELHGRPLLSVKSEETYCEEQVENCPPECTCYRRSIINHIIVDCRNLNLTKIHNDLPSGKLELWYSENNISEMYYNEQYEQVFALDLSMNGLQSISEEALKIMVHLEAFYLHSNLLTYIPDSIQDLHLKTVSLSPNPLRCDCKAVWMKEWIIRNKDVIKDWHDVTCNVNNEIGRVVAEVPDELFVCAETDEFDSMKHVVVPSIVTGVVLVLLFATIVAVYTYRLECKVLLFVYFGLHPFDKDNEHDEENIDCVIVHAGEQTDWVMNHIVKVLEHKYYNYIVCDMARDFVIGFSFHDNLSRNVKQSKRMIFCLTKDWNPSSESFNIAWNIAQEKIKETKSNFGIIVTHGVTKEQIHDKELLRFMDRKRYVDSSEKMFASKVIYYMPDIQTIPRQAYSVRTKSEERIAVYVVNKDGNNLENGNEELALNNDLILHETQHAFVSYSDVDLQYVTTFIQPMLESKGFSLCIPDRDFVPGASKEENILNAIHTSMRTIFILSGSHILDEWSLFTFRNAYEKSLREKTNHLIVIVRDDVDVGIVDQEIKQYLKSYISLYENDKWFENKLFNGFSLLTDNKHSLKNRLLIEEQCTTDIIAHF